MKWPKSYKRTVKGLLSVTSHHKISVVIFVQRVKGTQGIPFHSGVAHELHTKLPLKKGACDFNYLPGVNFSKA